MESPVAALAPTAVTPARTARRDKPEPLDSKCFARRAMVHSVLQDFAIRPANLGTRKCRRAEADRSQTVCQAPLQLLQEDRRYPRVLYVRERLTYSRQRSLRRSRARANMASTLRRR